MLTAFSLFLLSCGPADVEWFSIQDAATGDYVVTLLASSDQLQQSSNRMAVEIRDAATNDLRAVDNVQIQATMSMPGMAPMFGQVSAPTPTVPGRYEFVADFSMTGGWALIVTFAPDHRLQFNVNAY